MSVPNVPEVFKKGWKPPVQSQQTTRGKQRAVLCRPSGKLQGKAALVTGADSGIGRVIAIHYALEGADVAIAYKPKEKEDSSHVEKYISEKTKGRSRVVHAPFDLRTEGNCQKMIDAHLKAHNGRLDTLILNHGTQQAIDSLPDLPSERWRDVLATNIHSFFYTAKHALPHTLTHAGATIILCASVNPSVGRPELVDYTATKGAIIGFGRALSNQVVGERGIRVNMVAPGPIWTPLMFVLLLVLLLSVNSKESFGVTNPIGRCGQPVEVATCFALLASADSSYLSGQILHPNGGVIIAYKVKALNVTREAS